MKQNIREQYLTYRKNFDENYLKASSNAISEQCFKFIMLKQFKKIAVFYPLKNEVSLINLVMNLHKKCLITALPALDNNNIKFLNWAQDQPLSKIGKFYQPAASSLQIIPDLIICPLIAFDREGHRLGYGKGFYDRALENCATSFKMGVAFSKQEYRGKLPAEPHDQPLNLIITESEKIWTP